MSVIYKGGITAYGYAFYAVVVRTDHGHGVPVAYVLTSVEDVQTLTLAFNRVVLVPVQRMDSHPCVCHHQMRIFNTSFAFLL